MVYIGSFAQTVEEVRLAREWLDCYESLFNDIEVNGFKQEQIETLLKDHPNEILGTLYWAIDNKKLSLNTDAGRNVWQTVRQFYHENNRMEEWGEIAKGIHRITALGRHIFLDIYSSLIGVLASISSYGYINGSLIVDNIQRKASEKFVSKHIGSLEATL